MTEPTTYENLYNATARVEKMLWIGAMLVDPECVSEEFDISDFSDKDLKRCFPNISERLLKSIEEDEGDFYDLADHCRKVNQLGFLCQIATPVMTYLGNGTNSYSWGYYRTRWVYGDTPDEALSKGLIWAKKCRRSEKTIYLKKRPDTKHADANASTETAGSDV